MSYLGNRKQSKPLTHLVPTALSSSLTLTWGNQLDPKTIKQECKHFMKGERYLHQTISLSSIKFLFLCPRVDAKPWDNYYNRKEGNKKKTRLQIYWRSICGTISHLRAGEQLMWLPKRVIIIAKERMNSKVNQVQLTVPPLSVETSINTGTFSSRLSRNV